jgi:hypothetical protein
MNMTGILGEDINMTDVYNPHVKSYPSYPAMKTPYQSLDYSLGTFLILCTLVGVPGNIMGALFFSSTTREDSVALLYTVVCSVDTVTSFAHLPVTVAMLSGRRPGIFNNHLFCALWDVMYSILQKISMFLVLLLSTFRTVIIINAYYKIRAKIVMGCVVGYLAILLLIPLLRYVIPPLRGEYKYSWDGAYCYYNFRMKFEHAVNLVLVGLPPILTFMTLVVSVIKLKHSARRYSAVQSDQYRSAKILDRWKHRAGVTITMFTILFLVCNLPLFINLMHNMTTRFFGVEYPGVYFGSRFMFWYSWHIARMESVVVNAALNPILYYCRMMRFRGWCGDVTSCISLKRKDYGNHRKTGFMQMEAFKSKITGITMAQTTENAVELSRFEEGKSKLQRERMKSPSCGFEQRAALAAPSFAIENSEL